jgi:hypothetical protein
MNSYISWAIFLVLLGGLSWHYAGRPNVFVRVNPPKPFQQNSEQGSGASTRKQKSRAKRSGDNQSTLKEDVSARQPPSSESNISKKRKIATPQINVPSMEYSSGRSEFLKADAGALTRDGDGSNNTDFAREMAVARTGTQFASNGKSGLSKKERRAQKQGRLLPSDTDSPYLSTGASSTTGADADDDLSPVASPPFAPTSTAASSKSGDISDMLGAPVVGPSVLRLTDPVNPVPTPASRSVNKTFEPAETKKQRQQRIKREAQRAQVEEAEKERRRLMEKQIRGARMAEGSSAQSRTSAFKPPINAWQSAPGQSLTQTTKMAGISSAPLLDTFDPVSSTASLDRGAPDNAPLASITNGRKPADTSLSSTAEAKPSITEVPRRRPVASEENSSGWPLEFPAEQEQIRLIQDNEDSWTTVSKRDKKKSLMLQGSKDTDTSDASGMEGRRTNSRDAKSASNSRPVPSNNSNSYHQLADSGLQDSEWAA